MICLPGDQGCHKKHPPEITNVGAGLSVNRLKTHNHQIKICPSLNSIDHRSACILWVSLDCRSTFHTFSISWWSIALHLR
jgi:hypothetical protein